VEIMFHPLQRPGGTMAHWFVGGTSPDSRKIEQEGISIEQQRVRMP
jgi:hypothetical protein